MVSVNHRYLKFLIKMACLLCLLLVCTNEAYMQDARKEASRPRDLRIVSEGPDGKGNRVRVVEYKIGNMIVTETIYVPIRNKFDPFLDIPINPDTLLRDSLLIVVDKSNYFVKLMYKKKLVRRYRATFGPEPKRNKTMEGDRCTPEGWYTISRKNPASQYHKFLGISYPNDSATRRFNRLKAQGLIPANARIGGDIGIHGIWKGGDELIELSVGWTDGCIALKNQDIDDLFKLVGVGTRVFIRR